MSFLNTQKVKSKKSIQQYIEIMKIIFYEGVSTLVRHGRRLRRIFSKQTQARTLHSPLQTIPLRPTNISPGPIDPHRPRQ